MLQLRNYNNETKEDYIISPVRKNDTAKNFDSRKASADQPQNADANGAYNIARRGLMQIKRLECQPNDGVKPSEMISDIEYLSELQGLKNKDIYNAH
jgi:CRISPR-associated protein Cpf1